jgi:putative ABC transport system permease protein
VFEGLAARSGSSFILTGGGPPENLIGARISANTFSLLGLTPLLGRDFLAEEETYGKHQVALLSHQYWQRRFGGDRDLVGRTIALNSEPYTVVGVMPPGTSFPRSEIEIWAPLAFSPDQLRQRHAHNYQVYGKLKPGVTLAVANAEMELIARRMAEADPESRGWGAEVHPLHEVVVGDSRRALLVLLGAVGMVLLIACANIANLLLARSAARQREFAIRAALGAGRSRLIRQLLTESLLLAALGGLAGLSVASFGLNALVRLSPPELPRSGEGIQVDGLALAFTALVTLGTGILSGLLPAVEAASPALTRRLNESARASAGRPRQRLRSTLVVAEVALSVILLISAGLLIRSFGRLLSQSVGFTPEHLVTLGIDLPRKRYRDQAERERFFDRFLDRARALPGVQSAALVLGLPLSGLNNELEVTVRDAPPQAPGEAVSAGYAQVSPGYFRTMDIPLLQGRDFTDQDRAGGPPVMVVDETFVKKFKLAANPLGRRINIGDGTEDVEIIGVVKDIKHTGMVDPPRGEMYRPYRQITWGSMSVVARTRRQPEELARVIRAELDALDPDQPIWRPRAMSQLVSAAVAQRRLSVQLLGGFAGAAMLLAAMGLYGLLAYNIAQRTHEIGIRMALGARRSDVVRLVLGQGLGLSAAGIAIGLAGALASTRLLRGLLFEIGPGDPVSFAAVTVLLAIVALLACWLPALRATRVEPLEALRYG